MAWLDDFAKELSGRVPSEVVEALNMRGVSDDQIRDYSIGYLKGDLPSLEYPQGFLDWSDNGSKLQDVYCFPLTNTIGDVRGIQFRPVCREVRGYMDFFVEAGEPVLFGLAQAMPKIWASQEVTLVEGVFDLFPIQRCAKDWPAPVAVMSTHATEALMRNLARLCLKIVLGYDNDSTGRRSAEKFVKDYGQAFKVLNVEYTKVALPNSDKFSKDPGDLWELWGDEKLSRELATMLDAAARRLV